MVIALDKQKGLFRDEKAYEQFVQMFQKALAKNGMPLIVLGGEVLFTALSPESTQQMLAERILKRLSENPHLLAELRERLEGDEIVD